MSDAHAAQGGLSEFRMPSLGADMEAGTVVRWLVQPGDRVRRGDIVAIVDTDKADVEVEIFQSGTVSEILVVPGERVPVGTPLARVTVEVAETPIAPSPAPSSVPAPVSPTKAAPAIAPPATAPSAAAPSRSRRARPSPAAAPYAAPAAAPYAAPAAAPSARRRVSPLARTRAAELGVDLEALSHTTRDRPIGVADVEAAVGAGVAASEAGARAQARVRTAPAPAPAPIPTSGLPSLREPTAPTERQAKLRQAIAALMERSKREVPHYYLAQDVDCSRMLAWIEERNVTRPVTERLLPAALMLRAVALAVRETPDLNGFWIDGALRRSDAVHLGVAISLRGGGLLAPAVHDADRLDVSDLMAALKDLVTRARTGSLRASEMADPTITVTNLGDQGVDSVFPVIYPPQVAIVGFGRIAERPWAEHGMVGVRSVVTTTLAADHRATDGHLGARFLNALARQLQDPQEW